MVRIAGHLCILLQKMDWCALELFVRFLSQLFWIEYDEDVVSVLMSLN